MPTLDVIYDYHKLFNNSLEEILLRQNMDQQDYQINPNTDQELMNIINYDELESKQMAQKILNLLKIKTETNTLKNIIVTFAIILVICGITINTLFNTIMVIRKKYTTNVIIMLTMSFAYLIYLIFYCFKISVYINDIAKYHIYDTIETWIYGAFMCQLINALLPICKFITRFSILLLCIKHIIVLFQMKNNEAYYTKDENNVIGNENLRRKRKLIKKIFKYFSPPYLILPLLLIWLLSILASLPIYNTYKLTLIHNSTTFICDTIYEYPYDNNQYALILFNYLIFGTVLPCILITICLIVICVMNCIYDLDYSDENIDKRKTFLLIILIFLIHIATTLPQDIYKYMILINNKENDIDEVDIGLMQSIIDQLTNPITQARLYYGLQFLYISEFVFIPFVFLLFYLLQSSHFAKFCCCCCCWCGRFNDGSGRKSHYNVTNISLSSTSTDNLNKPDQSLLNNDMVIERSIRKISFEKQQFYLPTTIMAMNNHHNTNSNNDNTQEDFDQLMDHKPFDILDTKHGVLSSSTNTSNTSRGSSLLSTSEHLRQFTLLPGFSKTDDNC